MAGYRTTDDVLSVARLLSNLVALFNECGRFPEAQTAYTEAQAIFTKSGEDALFYLLNLEQNYGLLLHNRGLYNEALAVYEHALALSYNLDRTDKVVELQVNRTLTLGMLGRLAEGETALLQSRDLAGLHNHALTIARIDMNLGELYAALGRPSEALRRLQTAHQLFTNLGNSMEVGSVLLREATLFERIGSLRNARRRYAQAQAQFSNLQMQPQVGIALVRGAATSRQYGDYGQATHLLDEAESLWQELDQRHWLTVVRFERVALALAREDAAAALALLALPLPDTRNLALAAQRDLLYAEAWAIQGRDSTARLAYEQALGYAREQGDRWMERQALAGLGRLLFDNEPAAAQGYLEAAANHDDLTRQALSVEELKASFQAQANDVLPLLARLAVEQAQPLQALAYAWRVKGSALLDLFQATDEVFAAPDTQAEIERLRQQLAVRRWSLVLQAADIGPESLGERADPDIAALEQQLQTLRLKRRHETAGAVPPADPAPLLAHMEADLLLEYLHCGDDLLALRAEPGGSCQAVWSGNAATILDLLDELQLSFNNIVLQSAERRTQHGASWLAEYRPLLQQAYDLLIAPLEPFPPETRLLIAPCEPLYMLPFAALWDGQSYLAERCQIQIIPTGALLATPPPVASYLAPPVVIAASAEGRLSAIQAEVSAIQAALPTSRCLVDVPQSLDYLNGLEEPPRFLHLAAHSVLREDAPIFSALRLASGLLSVEQCYELPLRGTELVTLSGCATASGLDSGGALLAFQSAFFVAGARQVLSSLWPIGDEATAHWMATFYRALAAGLSPAAALHQTQRVLLADPAHNHPAIWAAFVCSRR